MGLPLIQGRYLDGTDTRRTDRVCVVDEAFARHYWPGQSALGREIFQGGTPDSDGEAFRIVGVVGAVKQANVTEDAGQGAVYYPLSHRLDRNLFAVVRTSLSPESSAGTLRTVVRQLDGELPVSDIPRMPVRIADSLAGRRSPAFVVGLFSGLALVLTAIGTYGVLSYTVAQRRREIGLRMALGARPSQVRLQFFYLASRLILAGTMLGLLGAWLAGRAMQGTLFGVPSTHLPTLAVATAVLAGVSLAACLIPSGRAARVSAMEALAGD